MLFHATAESEEGSVWASSDCREKWLRS